MNRNKLTCAIFLLIMCAVFVFSLSSCGESQSGDRESYRSVDSPEASGSSVYTASSFTLDSSNCNRGYIMVKYTGSAPKIKVQITGSDEAIYTYTVFPGDYVTLPLTTGDGAYSVDVLENVSDDLYTLMGSHSIDVSLDDQFGPFLYPNQYVWFEEDMECVSLAADLSDKSSDDLNFVERVYNYVLKNIDYDYDKASNIPIDYIPDINSTLESGKGICFDYASLMAAMLRSQKVPTKLVVGYSGSAYHSWISVYTEETGWVDNIIEFDGKSWSLMDPTLASSNDDASVRDYVGDGSNYTVKYNY